MNALSYFFAAFLLFSSQAHSSNILLEHFSERFAQARIPTRRDLPWSTLVTVGFSCTEYFHDGTHSSRSILLYLSKDGMVHTDGLKPSYLVFTKSGLTGIWDDERNNLLYRSTWKIESHGKWISEWMGKLKKGASRRDYSQRDATPWLDANSDMDDIAFLSYSICKKLY